MNDLLPIFDLPAVRPMVIAGPCSAESEVQVLETAQLLAAAGIRVFRAGVWKPRTKPGNFEGIGSAALPWLARVKSEIGMIVAVEVANAAHLHEALEAGVDGIWLGARTTANPFAVQEIADALALLPSAKRSAITVLIKNPVNPDLDLWIGAIERIYAAGIRRIGAIHRGFSSYGKHPYRNMPHWAIPIELRRRLPALPLICDPSHIGGARDLIGSLSQQALDMNFDGLIIESHVSPDAALSDAAQQLTPGELIEVLKTLKVPSETNSTQTLDSLRREIDSIDIDILNLLSQRMNVSREIGRYKHDHNMPVLQADRYNGLIQRHSTLAPALDLSPEFVRDVFAAIHEESVRQQLQRKKNV